MIRRRSVRGSFEPVLSLEQDTETSAATVGGEGQIYLDRRVHPQMGLDRRGLCFDVTEHLPPTRIHPKPLFCIAAGQPDESHGTSVVGHRPHRQGPMVVRRHPHLQRSVRAAGFGLGPELPTLELETLAQMPGVLGEHPAQGQGLVSRYPTQATHDPPRQGGRPPLADDDPCAPGRRMCCRFDHRRAR